MTKQQLIYDIKHLLTNDYGDYGKSGIGDYLVRFPANAIPPEERSWNSIHIYEIFLSDTESGVAVSNYKCQVADCTQLPYRSLYLILRALLEIRSPSSL